MSAESTKHDKVILTDRSATKERNPEPGQTGTDERNTRAAESYPVAGICVDSGLFKEVTRTVHKAASIGNLGNERDTCNLSATEISSLEAVPVGCTLKHFHFQVSRSLHQCNGALVLGGVNVGGETGE